MNAIDKRVYTEDIVRFFAQRYKPANPDTWPFYVITMPLNADGMGPCEIKGASKISFEVWDRFLSTHSSHEFLRDAISEAITLNNELFKTYKGVEVKFNH